MKRVNICTVKNVRASRISLSVTVCGDTTTITAAGKIVCGDSAGLLREALGRFIQRDTRAITIDLRGAERIDANALGILAFAYATARSSGIRLTVENPSPLIQEMFRVTGLNKFFGPPAVGAAKAAS